MKIMYFSLFFTIQLSLAHFKFRLISFTIIIYFFWSSHIFKSLRRFDLSNLNILLLSLLKVNGCGVFQMKLLNPVSTTVEISISSTVKGGAAETQKTK